MALDNKNPFGGKIHDNGMEDALGFKVHDNGMEDALGFKVHDNGMEDALGVKNYDSPFSHVGGEPIEVVSIDDEKMKEYAAPDVEEYKKAVESEKGKITPGYGRLFRRID